jgi:hypothetical protein
MRIPRRKKNRKSEKKEIIKQFMNVSQKQVSRLSLDSQYNY